MKDWLLQKGAEKALGMILRDYGTVRRVTLNSAERWCEVELDLKGEHDAVLLRADDVTFRTNVEQMFVRVGRIGCSREWLKRLGEQFFIGREFALPPKAAMAIRVLL